MKNLLEDIKSNWILVLFIGSLIVGWTTFNSRLTQAESDIIDLKTVMKSVTNTNNEINSRLIKIETSVEFIKDKVQ